MGIFTFPRCISAVTVLTSFLCRGQVIVTIAGAGSNPSSGIAATSAATSASQGIAVDHSGNVYFWNGPVVSQVNTAGIINTIAGNGGVALAPFQSIGDGGPATNAAFGPNSAWAGLAVDGAGNIYISDPGNSRVRKANTAGIITTFAGGGGGGDGGQASSAGLGQPTGIAADSAGNVYIADLQAGRVRKVNTSGIISTYAGGGSGGDGGPATSAALVAPRGLALDSQGNLYIAEGNALVNRVRKVDPSGTISTVAGGAGIGYAGDGGPATSALLDSPLGVAVDSAGNIYIADSLNNRVREVNASGTITTVAGFGGPGNSGDGGLPQDANITPGGLAFDSSGNLYISCTTVREVVFGEKPLGITTSLTSMYFYTSVKDTDAPNQVLLIESLGGPQISFTITNATQSGGNWLSTSSANGSTTAGIRVGLINPPSTAGTYKGTITLTPATPGYSTVVVNVTLVVSASPPATPVITSIENGASFQAGYYGNSIWRVMGTNLASTTDTWNNSIVNGELPTELDGVTVTFGDMRRPI